MTSFALTLLLSLASPALAADAPGECSEDRPALPAFALPDVNPSSASFGGNRSPSDALGQVLVIYWAHAT